MFPCRSWCWIQTESWIQVVVGFLSRRCACNPSESPFLKCVRASQLVFAAECGRQVAWASKRRMPLALSPVHQHPTPHDRMLHSRFCDWPAMGHVRLANRACHCCMFRMSSIEHAAFKTRAKVTGVTSILTGVRPPCLVGTESLNRTPPAQPLKRKPRGTSLS